MFGSTCIAAGLLLTACSGSDADSVADDPANAPIAQVDGGSGGIAESGPISGLLTVQPSFGFGLYSVDPATGLGVAIPGIASVESIERDADVIVNGDAAYALGGRARDGQTLASDISIVKIDYRNGQASRLAPLGFDRETDASQEIISYTLEAVTAEVAVVRQVTLGQDNTQYRIFNLESGEEQSSFGQPRYEFQTDAGRCEGNITNLIGLSDGRVAGAAVNSPAILDVENGSIEPLIGCDQERPQLGSLTTAAELEQLAVFNEGSDRSVEALTPLLAVNLVPGEGFVEGDEDLWWINAEVRREGDVDAIVGGLVRFDLAEQAVVAIYPLGEYLGRYIDCGDGSESCEILTLQQAELRYIADRIIIVDTNENGSLLTVDPVTGALTATEIERGPGIDFTTASLLDGDPNGAWLEVRRFTITSEEGATRTAASADYVERVNPESGAIDISLAGEDIFF